MTLLMYGVAHCHPSAIEGHGMEGRPLQAVGSEPLVAVVSEAAGLPDTTSEETLWQYERVVEGLMDAHAILPARFGSVLAEHSEAEALLDRRREELLAALDRVRGAVELGVRAVWAEPQQGGSSPQTGTAYMLRRLALERAAREVARRLEPLDALARESAVRVLPGGDVAVAGAYLVDREQVGQFAETVARLDEAIEGADLVCTGPWPPYSFAQGGQR